MVALVNGQRIEFSSAEELAQCNAETIAELFYVDRAGVFAFAEENALDGGLGYTGYLAHLVGRYIVLLTKLPDAAGDNWATPASLATTKGRMATLPSTRSKPRPCGSSSVCSSRG